MTDLQSNGAFADVHRILNDGNNLNHPYIRSGNVGAFFIDKKDLGMISTQAHKSLLKTQTKLHDVLIARKGKIGGASIIMGDAVDFNSNDNVVNLRVTDGCVNPFYLTTFLNSKYGYKQIERLATGNVQPWLSMYQVRHLFIIPQSLEFQNEIQSVIEQAYKVMLGQLDSYNQAENLLLETLGMADFSPSAEKVNIKSFKDSFAATSRLDAEYYQPKYEDVITQIQSQAHARLAQLVSITKSIEPGSDAYSDDDNGLPFLRVADYSKLGLQTTQKKLSVRFVAENKAQLTALMPKANTILFSKDGSVGEAYCLSADADFVTSSAILHLQVLDNTKILPNYLTLALNSTLVRMQAERDAGGSIILHWRVSEIENVIIPLVDFETQTKIAALVQQSFSLRAESERLLDAAKQAVETAIETNEDAALAWLTSIH